MRLRELEYFELIYLLENSHIQENKYGAAYILETKYADFLTDYLMKRLNNSESATYESLKDIIEILGLESIKNRSTVIGKAYDRITKDYENWKYISKRVTDIINKNN